MKYAVRWVIKTSVYSIYCDWNHSRCFSKRGQQNKSRHQPTFLWRLTGTLLSKYSYMAPSSSTRENSRLYSRLFHGELNFQQTASTFYNKMFIFIAKAFMWKRYKKKIKYFVSDKTQTFPRCDLDNLSFYQFYYTVTHY